MNRLTLIRYAVLVLMRDLCIPGGGLFLAVYLPLTGRLEPWHLPLLAGMLGTPLVARGEKPPEKPPEKHSSSLSSQRRSNEDNRGK